MDNSFENPLPVASRHHKQGGHKIHAFKCPRCGVEAGVYPPDEDLGRKGRHRCRTCNVWLEITPPEGPHPD